MSSPPREVVRLITRLNIGGPARQALLLTKELEVQWPTLLGAGTPSAEEGELNDPDVSVHRLPLVRPVRPVTDMQAFVQVRRLLQAHQPRLVHTHMAKAGLIGRLACLGLRIRTVHTYHGHVLSGYFSKPVQRTFIKIERALARNSDVLVAVSREVMESLLELGIGREEQYRMIPLGFDLSEHLLVEQPQGTLKSHLRLAPETPLVGSVGRLVPIKDLVTLVKAMLRVPGAHLAVLGDGQSRADLEAFTRSLGLTERVHFTGWYTDIPAAMSDFDLVALSSLNEGTPVSLIEAGACARAVVATDVGGVAYVVDHGTTGLLCPPGEPEALAESIKTLLSDRDRRVRMGEAGRERARALFHKDRLLSDIHDLYAGLVGK